MNMMDHSRMATPPAPQPRWLRRLRIVSAALCLASALGVLGIEPIRQFSIYAVALVALVMLGAVVTVTLYWILRRRVEAAYWTPSREAAHIDGVVRGIDLRRRQGAGGIILDRRRIQHVGVFTQLWNATVRLGRRAPWWTPR